VVNVSVLVAIGVSKDGYREVLGAMEGAKEDKASWRAFLLHLKERGLTSPLLFIADKHLGFIEAFGEIFPETSWQRCMVHFYRNIFSIVPNGKVREVVAMLKAIHAQEDIHAARAKAKLW
jgi:transposase-like protein